MEEKPIESLFELQKKANDMWEFKGRAGLIRKIHDSIDFIRSHKTGPKIEAMLLKERLKDYEAGVKIMDEKYKDKEPESETIN